MITTRNVHRSDGIIVGRIHRATGNDRARYCYSPLDELPDVVYGGESYVTGDASWWESWSDARADIVRWSWLGLARRTNAPR